MPTMDADIRFAIVPAIIAAFGSQRSDAPYLNPDGAEIGKAAEREGCDGEGARVQRALHRAELAKRDKFIDGHASAEQIADGRCVVPGNADEPRHGSKHPTEDR